MSKPSVRKQYRCELCNGLVSANAYTPCCGKLLCAACADLLSKGHTVRSARPRR
jgi:formylmethanofuran dehydrogenase subunit E